jgi:hypothetical protein
LAGGGELAHDVKIAKTIIEATRALFIFILPVGGDYCSTIENKINCPVLILAIKVGNSIPKA